MPLVDYTSYDQVRAALGVDALEISDATLALELYDSALQSELEDISANLAADYAAVVLVTAGSRSAVQAKFYRVLRLFATYTTAKQLASSIPMFGPKDISDGKATVSRFADSPYKAVIAEVKSMYERYRNSLVSTYAELKSTTATNTARVYLSSSSLVDPVTGV